MKDYRPKIVFAAVAVIAAFFMFWNIRHGSLVNSDDSIYAEIIKQMLVRGEWLHLYWQDFDYMTKPPLFFWMGAVSAKMFGLNEFALRLPSALMGFSTVLLVFFFAKRISGETGAFVASFVLLGFKLFLNLSHRVMLDVPLVFFITASIYGFLRGIDEAKYLYLGWISAGLGFLVKGLAFWPAVAVPVIYCLALSKYSVFKKKEFFAGFASFMVLFLPWQVYNMLSPKGGVFISRFFSGQVVSHYLGQGMSYFKKPFFFYARRFYEIDWGIFMLALLALILLGVFWKKIEFRKISVFVIWIIAYFLVYSFSSSKLDHYMLGIYPPLAILVGYVFSDRIIASKAVAVLIKALVLLVALVNFAPYMDAHSWHVDSSRGIKALVQRYNSVSKGKERLFSYSVYIPAPIFYSDGEVTGVVKTERLFDLYSSIAEFKGKILKLDEDAFCGKMKEGRPYALMANPVLSVLVKSCHGLKVLEEYGGYSLVYH